MHTPQGFPFFLRPYEFLLILNNVSNLHRFFKTSYLCMDKFKCLGSMFRPCMAKTPLVYILVKIIEHIFRTLMDFF